MVDLVADAILAGTEAEENGGAELALMNTGGVRASLRYNTITNGEQPGEITYAGDVRRGTVQQHLGDRRHDRAPRSSKC